MFYSSYKSSSNRLQVGILLALGLVCMAFFVGSLLRQAVPTPTSEGAPTALVSVAPPGIPRPGLPVPKKHSLMLSKLASVFGNEPKNLKEKHVVIAPGSTLIALLQDADVPHDDAYTASASLKKVWDVRQLRPNQSITLVYGPTEEGALDFQGLYFRPKIEQDIVLHRTDNGFAAKVLDRALSKEVAYGGADINSSFFAAGSSAGLPIALLTKMFGVFSHTVDFQRDLRAGDSFEVLYERLIDEEGSVARTDKLLYASLNLRGTAKKVYYFDPQNGDDLQYYDRKGESVKRELLRTPLAGARISSGYGMRKHPVLGYSKMHKGIDFAAPTGTPIRAAGNGVIAKRQWLGAYGNYIRIRHNSEYSTAYAHLSKFAKGVKVGTRVKQGQVIGYVGSTGRSTGPHLHYEILRKGKQINPGKFNLRSGSRLASKELKSFKSRVAEIDVKLTAMRQHHTKQHALDASVNAQEDTIEPLFAPNVPLIKAPISLKR